MNILALIAGTNEPSNSNALADAFLQGVHQFESSTTVKKIRLKDLHIEHFTLDNYTPQCNQEEDFCKVQKLIEEADGVLIATPIWNFGVPAHLKNLIDRMGSFALDASRSKGTLNGQPYYLIFTGGAPKPAWDALMRKTTSFVPEALKYFGASHIGTYFEGKCTKGRGQFGLVVDERPESMAKAREEGKKFAEVVYKYVETGQPPAKHRIQSTIMRWGEAVLKKVT